MSSVGVPANAGRCVVALALAGCLPAPTFACEDARQCVLGSVVGVCEGQGYCSYPDDDCESGRRFHGHAPAAFANSCVDPSTTSDSATTPPPSSSSSSSGTTDSSGSAGPSDSTGAASECGNGIVEPPETCDDGDALDDDVCNRNCEAAGALLWIDTPTNEGPDSARGVAILTADDVLVAAEVTRASAIDAQLRRYDPEGPLRWDVDYAQGPGDEAVGGVAAAVGDGFVYAGSSGPNAVVVAFDGQGTAGPSATEATGHWSAVVVGENGRIYATGDNGDAALTQCYLPDLSAGCGSAIASGGGATEPERGAALIERGGELLVAGNVDPGDSGDTLDAFVQRLTLDVNEIELAIEPGLARQAWRAAAPTLDGGYVLAGSVNESGAQRQIRVQQFSAGGPLANELVVDRGPSATDLASGIAVDGLGNVIAVGDLDLAPDTDARPYGLWLAKFSPDLTEIWSREIEGNNVRGWAVAVDSDDNIIIAGEHEVAGDTDLLVAKFSP